MTIGDKKFRRAVLILEQLFEPKVRKVIQKQISSFISDFKLYGQTAALNNLQSSINDDLFSLLMDIYKKSGVAGARITAMELKSFLKRGRKKADPITGTMGRNARWIQEILDYLNRDGLEFVFNINETTKNIILRILERGTRDQWSFQEIVNALESDNLSRMRARRITRTEIVRGANQGHLIAAKEFPYEVNKKWVSGLDHRVRHSHLKMNGVSIDEDDLFNVPVYDGDVKKGSEQMTAPGDPKASPGNTINCRCRITHIPKRDSKGNLIERSSTTARIIPLRSNTGQQDNLRDAIAAALKMRVD